MALPIIFAPKLFETAIIGTSIGAGMTLLVFSMHQLGRVNIFGSSHGRSQQYTSRIETKKRIDNEILDDEIWSADDNNKNRFGLLELAG